MVKQSSLPLSSKGIPQLFARLCHKCKRPLTIKYLFRRVAILQVAHKPLFRSGKVNRNRNHISTPLLGAASVRLICEKVPQ